MVLRAILSSDQMSADDMLKEYRQAKHSSGACCVVCMEKIIDLRALVGRLAASLRTAPDVSCCCEAAMSAFTPTPCTCGAHEEGELRRAALAEVEKESI